MNCPICDKRIPKERLEVLRSLGKPEHLWACVACTQDRPYKAIYMGEYGTSELVKCSQVYSDSASQVFDAQTQITDSDKDVQVEIQKIGN